MGPTLYSRSIEYTSNPRPAGSKPHMVQYGVPFTSIFQSRKESSEENAQSGRHLVCKTERKRGFVNAVRNV